MKKLKRRVCKFMSKFKYLIFHYLTLYLNFFITNKKIIKELKEKGISNATPFKLKTWHFGYKYYIGFYQEQKVFIKYNKNAEWIKYEYSNFEYVIKKSPILTRMMPKIFAYKNMKYGSILIEEFLPFESLSNIVEQNVSIEKNKIYAELKKLIIESQKINFKFLDLNPTNIFIDDENGVHVIDLGFSNINRDGINFIKNEKIKKMIVNSLNDFSRLEVGVIDDAYSVIQICKYIDSEFISNNYNIWRDMNQLMSISVFDKKELNNED